MISNFGCKLLLALFGWTTAILRPARAGPDFKLASITSSRKLFCSRAIRGHTSNIWSFQQHCQGDVLQQGQLGCKMRVRVTNFTSLVATVDFPLVLISGCVDNYSDQVDSSFFASSSEQCSAVEDQSITELKMWHHALRYQSPFFPCALDDYKLLDTFLQLHFAGHLRLSGVQHLADNLIWPFRKMSVITLFGISRKSTFWDGDQTSKAGSVEPTCSLEFNIGFRFEVMFRREVKSHKHASTWIHTLEG